MAFDYTLINGVSLGFEILDKDQVSLISEDGKWGLACDLFIFRFLVVKF